MNRIALVLFVLAVACSSSGAGTVARAFAECCTDDSECASGVCSKDHLACSIACVDDSECPAEPKSGEAKCSGKSHVCEAERSGSDSCESHSGTDSGSAIDTGGDDTGSSVDTGSSADTGTKPETSSGTLGIGEPCSDATKCKSGICYRPGGSPGFCTTSCSTSFDAACSGDSAGGKNSFGEYIVCMSFAGGGRCYPGCVNSATACSHFAGVHCVAGKDIKSYNVKACVE